MKTSHFDVTKCLPYDIMHTLFEGVAPYHLNLLLGHIIDAKGYLTLQKLNHSLLTHCFGYSESDTKPSQIERDRSDRSKFRIRQSGKVKPGFNQLRLLLIYNLYTTNPASQMMTLVRLLPFVIGEFVDDDDDHWSRFLLLWDICCLSTAFEVTEADANQLAWLVEAYLECFTSLYSVPVIPKMHYLVHLPEQMLRYVHVHMYLHVSGDFMHAFWVQVWPFETYLVHEI